MIKPLTTHRALTLAIELSQAALAMIQEGDSETTAARKLHEGGEVILEFMLTRSIIREC